MKLFTTIYDDARLLGHFLRHYSQAGVTEFYIAVSPGFGDAVRGFIPSFQIRLFEDVGVNAYPFGVDALIRMRRHHHVANEWGLVVDLDEFIEFPKSIDLLIEDAELAGANLIQGIMYDRFSADGQPRGFEATSDLSSLYPVRARFAKEVCKGLDHKGVIVKGFLQPDGHFHEWRGQVVHSQVLTISHYKWRERTLERTKSDLRIISENPHWSGGAIQFQRVLDHYDQHGRFAWETFGGENVGDRSRNLLQAMLDERDRALADMTGRAQEVLAVLNVTQADLKKRDEALSCAEAALSNQRAETDITQAENAKLSAALTVSRGVAKAVLTALQTEVVPVSTHGPGDLLRPSRWERRMGRHIPLLTRIRAKSSVVSLADRARDAGQWELAAAYYKIALRRKPNNPPIWVQYGHVLKESGHLAEAERAYRMAVAYDQSIVDSHLQLGRALKLQGKKEEALAAYIRAFSLCASFDGASSEFEQVGWTEAHLLELQDVLGGMAFFRHSGANGTN